MAVFGFLERWTKRDVDAKAAATRTYGSLVHKAAEAGDLSPGDQSKLEQAAEAIGLTLDRIGRDLAAAAKARKLTVIIASKAERRQAMVDANAAHHDARAKVKAAQEAERAAYVAAATAENVFGQIADAERELFNLKNSNPGLLG